MKIGFFIAFACLLAHCCAMKSHHQNTEEKPAEQPEKPAESTGKPASGHSYKPQEPRPEECEDDENDFEEGQLIRSPRPGKKDVKDPLETEMEGGHGHGMADVVAEPHEQEANQKQQDSPKTALKKKHFGHIDGALAD